MILCAVLQMTTGQTPGFLSSAINWQARKGERPIGSTKVVLRHLAINVKEWQRSLDAALKAVQSYLQHVASKPEGPAAHVVLRAADKTLDGSG